MPGEGSGHFARECRAILFPGIRIGLRKRCMLHTCIPMTTTPAQLQAPLPPLRPPRGSCPSPTVLPLPNPHPPCPTKTTKYHIPGGISPPWLQTLPIKSFVEPLGVSYHQLARRDPPRPIPSQAGYLKGAGAQGYMGTTSHSHRVPPCPLCVETSTAWHKLMPPPSPQSPQ